jgi:anti-sigma-K factor RskA
MSRCPRHDDAGPWVLGALAAEDAAAFATHLEGCDTCQADVAALQGVAGVLPMAAPQVTPPPELKSRIMSVVGAEAQLLRAAAPEADRAPEPDPGGDRRRRRRFGPPAGLRPLPAAALATVILAIGVAGGVLLAGGDGAQTRPGFGPRGAEVALRVDGHHGRLELKRMPAPPAGRVYQVWLVHGKSRPRPTHTLFTVARDGNASVDIMESLRGSDKILVTAEPMGGSEQPTSAPVAGAALT